MTNRVLAVSAAAAAALKGVMEAHKQRRQVDTDELAAINDARRCAATWREIADELGRHEPNVLRQFGPIPTGDGPPAERDAALQRLAAIPRRRDAAEAALIKAIAAAREVDPPVPWSKLGEVFGGRGRSNMIHSYRHRLKVTETRTVEVKQQQPRSRAQLTGEQRLEVTRRVRAGESTAELADEFGVSPVTVRWLRTYGPPTG